MCPNECPGYQHSSSCLYCVAARKFPLIIMINLLHIHYPSSMVLVQWHKKPKTTDSSLSFHYLDHNSILWYKDFILGR